MTTVEMGRKMAGITVYSLPEIAVMLKVTEVTLRTYVKKGLIVARKVGKDTFVTEEALQDFLKSKTIDYRYPKRKKKKQKIV